MDILEHRDDATFQLVARVARAAGQWWFRFRIRGLDGIPDGPCLFVGNHSGLGFVEELLFVGAWEERMGAGRRVYGLIHDMFFESAVFGPYYRRIGAIPASRENARAALDAGHSVLVFPGGDLDCCRPFYEPRTCHFGDRRGYARLALQTGVPVVPVVTLGSHWTYTFLPGGRALAGLPLIRRVFRTDRVPVPTAVLGAALALAFVAWGHSVWWLALAVVVGLLPTPTTITTEVGEAMDLRRLTANADQPVEAAHELVHGHIAARLRSLEPSAMTDGIETPVPPSIAR